MINEQKLNYAKHILINNGFYNFELNGYMGNDAIYSPHGLSRKIWKKASKDVGFTMKNLKKKK